MPTRHQVYRAGSLTPGQNAGAAADVTAYADSLRPEGHAPRTGALFAAPLLPGVVRWVLGNSACGFETRTREISLDPDTVWVYRVRSWERVHENDPASVAAYWGTGMTLSAWLTEHAQDAQAFDPAEWEVIVPTRSVLSTRNVSAARLMAAAPGWRHPELVRITRSWRRSGATARFATAVPG